MGCIDIKRHLGPKLNDADVSFIFWYLFLRGSFERRPLEQQWQPLGTELIHDETPGRRPRNDEKSSPSSYRVAVDGERFEDHQTKDEQDEGFIRLEAPAVQHVHSLMGLGWLRSRAVAFRTVLPA